jgi:predicted transposase/invertase (TIGR01784 family)
MPKKGNKIHDAFFYSICSHTELVIDLLKGSLHTEADLQLAWETLSIVQNKYVGNDLLKLECNFACSVKFNGIKNAEKTEYIEDAYLYTMVEHQSTRNRNMLHRFSKYNAALADHLFKKQVHKYFPIINTIWVYADKAPLNQTEFELYKTMEKRGLADKFSFKLPTIIDLCTLSKEEIIASFGKIALGLLLLKQGAQKEFLPWIKENPQLINNLVDTWYFEIVVKYMLECETKNSSKELLQALNEIIQQEQKEEIMSAANELRQEGRQEGIEIGEAKIIRNILDKGKSIEEVKNLTGLSTEEIKKLIKT